MLLTALFPMAGPESSTSAPPAGAYCHYISGMCCISDQLCCSYNISLQEKVQMYLCNIQYRYFFYYFIILTFHWLSRRRSKEQSLPIHVGLAVSLAFLSLIFFFNGVLANVGGESVCTWVGAVLHYALLCSFAWMGIEVLHTFWLVYMVFTPRLKPYIWNLVGFGEFHFWNVSQDT